MMNSRQHIDQSVSEDFGIYDDDLLPVSQIRKQLIANHSLAIRVLQHHVRIACVQHDLLRTK